MTKIQLAHRITISDLTPVALGPRANDQRHARFTASEAWRSQTSAAVKRRVHVVVRARLKV